MLLEGHLRVKICLSRGKKLDWCFGSLIFPPTGCEPLVASKGPASRPRAVERVINVAGHLRPHVGAHERMADILARCGVFITVLESAIARPEATILAVEPAA